VQTRLIKGLSGTTISTDKNADGNLYVYLNASAGRHRYRRFAYQLIAGAITPVGDTSVTVPSTAQIIVDD
jgi:hypothetical protein